MTAWEDLKARGLENAGAVLAGRQDVGRLGSLIRAWATETRGIYKGDRSEIAGHPATSRLADAFEDASLPDVADHLRRFGEETGPVHPGEWLFAVLLGRACAAAFVDSIKERRRYEAVLWNHETSGAWQSYKEEIAVLLESDDAARAAAWTHFDELIEEARRDPIRSAPFSGDRATGIAKAISDFAAEPDLEEAWETRLSSSILFRQAFFLKLMGRIDGRRYLSALARLPHPVFVGQALDEKTSGAALAFLLSAAPTGFGQKGTFEHEGIVIVALLRLVEATVRRHAWNGHQPASPEDTNSLELATNATVTALEPLLDAVLGRSDAVALSWAWLENLAYEVERRGVWRIDRRQGHGVALDAAFLLIHSIARRLALREDHRAWILENQPLWRIDRLAAVLAVALWGQEPTAERVEAILHWSLIEAAIEFHGADDALMRPGGIVSRAGAAALLVSGDPPSLLKSLWQKSRPVRERAWRTGGAAGSQIHVGQLLAFWGICALEASQAGVREQLEPQVETILRDAYQTERPSSPNRFWPNALRRFAKSMHLPVESDGDAVKRLAAFLRFFVRPDELFLELTVCVSDDFGIEQLRRSLCLIGVDLDFVVDSFLASESFRIEQGVYSTSWLDKVRGMRSNAPHQA